MRIHYTRHLKTRMAERNISKEQVEYCLQNYQVSRPGHERKTVYDYTDSNGYKTSVSAIKEKGIWVVASVWRSK